MKLEFKKEKNWQNSEEIYVKIKDGTHRNLRWIESQTGITRGTLLKRLKNDNIKTLEDFVAPKHKRVDDNWEGISDEARTTFETGSNKDILALKTVRVS